MTSNIPIEYESFLNRSILSVEGILTDPTILGLSGPGSNGKEEVLHTYPEYSSFVRILLFSRGYSQSISYTPDRADL